MRTIHSKRASQKDTFERYTDRVSRLRYILKIHEALETFVQEALGRHLGRVLVCGMPVVYSSEFVAKAARSEREIRVAMADVLSKRRAIDEARTRPCLETRGVRRTSCDNDASVGVLFDPCARVRRGESSRRPLSTVVGEAFARDLCVI